jgi:hypothetical protein
MARRALIDLVHREPHGAERAVAFEVFLFIPASDCLPGSDGEG